MPTAPLPNLRKGPVRLSLNCPDPRTTFDRHLRAAGPRLSVIVGIPMRTAIIRAIAVVVPIVVPALQRCTYARTVRASTTIPPRARVPVWRRIVLSLLVSGFVLCLPGCSTGRSGGSHRDIPAAWAGVWWIESTERDCVSSEVIRTTAELDTLCAGGALGFWAGGAPDKLTGAVDDSTIDVAWRGEWWSSRLVWFAWSGAASITRNGDSMHGTIRHRRLPNEECHEIALVGSRRSPAPTPCASQPVRNRSSP